jgi:tetratricopeptide (TPR) repeat protein
MAFPPVTFRRGIPRPVRSRWCVVTLVFLMAANFGTLLAGEKAEPWSAALNLDYNTAAATLEKQHAHSPDDPRLATAHAASLLVREPSTSANVALARTTLETVLAAFAPDDSEHRPLALYLLGRIAHDHQDPPRLDDAIAHYEQLRREHPGHALADQAAVHLGLIRALQLPPPEFQTAVTQVETLLAAVVTPAARRELHHLLAHLHWHGRGDAVAALPHYLAGRAIGFEAPYRNGEVDLTIAGLARDLGRDDLAARHYLAFAEANPRDGRAQTARRLAAEATAHLP